MGSLFTTIRRRRPDVVDNSATGENDQSLHQPLLHQPSTRTQDIPSLWNYLLSPFKYIIKLIKTILKSTLFHHHHSAPPYKLSIIQQSRLDTLFDRASIQYNDECQRHRDTLEKLWTAVFNSTTTTITTVDTNSKSKSNSSEASHTPFTLVSERWKEMGWQSNDPSRDFRGGGYLSLECLANFAEERTNLFHQLLAKSQQQTSNGNDDTVTIDSRYNYYPFCAAGVNVVHILVSMLHFKSGEVSRVASTSVGRGFLDRLRREEDAFEQLFVETLIEVDKQWELHGKEYMMFPMVLKKVREEVVRRLEAEEGS